MAKKTSSKKAAAAASFDEGPACNAWTPKLAPSPSYMAETSHLLILTGLIIGQGIMHFPEHIVQVWQYYFTNAPAHGIFGVFNLEWVHIMYNVGLLALMVPVMVGCGFFAKNNAWKRANYWAWWGVMASFWIQIVHVPEHYAKLAQYYMTGQQATPGLIGYWLSTSLGWGPQANLWLHFIINAVVLLPVVYAFFAYDVLGALRARFFPKPPSADGVST